MTNPLGQRESQTLEFKGEAALQDLSTIARGVVAMLNSTGGKVWVGVREQDQVAVQLEPITDVEDKIRRLHDHLIDTIEPSPAEDEVAVQRAEGDVIRIDVRPHRTQKPYAYSRSSGRLFVTRVGNRLRPLAREEVADLFRGSGDAGTSGKKTRSIIEKVNADLQQAVEKVPNAHHDLFWLRLQPIDDLELDFARLRRSELLTDPARAQVEGFTGNFTNAYVLGGRAPQLVGGNLTVGKEGVYWLAVQRDGGLLFTAPLASFGANPIQPGEPLLHPLYLLEYSVSMLRLVAAMNAAHEIWKLPERLPSAYVAHMALFGLGGWSLLPGTPGTVSYSGRSVGGQFAGDDLILDKPLVFSAEEIHDAADRCAFRLVARVYASFGFLEDAIPRQFDRKAGQYIPDRN